MLVGVVDVSATAASVGSVEGVKVEESLDLVVIIKVGCNVIIRGRR